jgi:CRAL/TRIO domain
MRFGKFQSLFTFVILVLQVAVKELVDADTSRTFPHAYRWPPIQWACEPLLEALYFADLPPLQHKTRNLCLKLRGGRLGGKDKGAGATVLERTNETKTETVVVTKTSTIDTVSTTDSDTSSVPVSEEYTFSLFQENDGSESDPDGIPRRYLKMQNHKRDHAKKALEATVEWRKEHDVDTILARPHPKFDICKDVFPHYFCGRDDSNHVILLQRPGLINLPLAHANGLTGDELLFHYVYEMEHLWQIMERDNPDATMTSVIDLTGLNISVLRQAELLAVAKKFVATMDAHFPQRSHRTYLINAPKWFGAIYKLISPLLRESTKEKIQIYAKVRRPMLR